jgi:hypothetical protein
MTHSIDRLSFLFGFVTGACGGAFAAVLTYWWTVQRIRKKLSAIFGAADNKLGGGAS